MNIESLLATDRLLVRATNPESLEALVRLQEQPLWLDTGDSVKNVREILRIGPSMACVAVSGALAGAAAGQPVHFLCGPQGPPGEPGNEGPRGPAGKATEGPRGPAAPPPPLAELCAQVEGDLKTMHAPSWDWVAALPQALAPMPAHLCGLYLDVLPGRLAVRMHAHGISVLTRGNDNRTWALTAEESGETTMQTVACDIVALAAKQTKQC